MPHSVLGSKGFSTISRIFNRLSIVRGIIAKISAVFFAIGVIESVNTQKTRKIYVIVQNVIPYSKKIRIY